MGQYEDYFNLMHSLHDYEGRRFFGNFRERQDESKSAEPVSTLERFAQMGEFGVVKDLAFLNGEPLPGHYSVWGPREIGKVSTLSYERAKEELMKLSPKEGLMNRYPTLTIRVQ